MKVVGIDPDTKAVTIAVAESSKPVRVERFEAKGRLAEDRFNALVSFVERGMSQISSADWVYVEKPVFGRSIKSTVDQTLVVGAIKMLLLQQGFRHSLIDNNTWKKDTIGDGHASKEQIKAWALAAYPDLEPSLQQDAYDAVCIARFGWEHLVERR